MKKLLTICLSIFLLGNTTQPINASISGTKKEDKLTETQEKKPPSSSKSKNNKGPNTKKKEEKESSNLTFRIIASGVSIIALYVIYQFVGKAKPEEVLIVLNGQELTLWDPKNDRLKKYGDHTLFSSASLSPDGEHLGIISGTGPDITIKNVQSNQEEETMYDHGIKKIFTQIAWNPDPKSNTFAIGTKTGEIYRFERGTPESKKSTLKSFNTNIDTNYKLIYSNDSQFMTANPNETLFIWDDKHDVKHKLNLGSPQSKGYAMAS